MKLDKPIVIEYTDAEVVNVLVQGEEMIVDFRLVDAAVAHEVRHHVVLRNENSRVWRGKGREQETSMAFHDGMVAASFGVEALCSHVVQAGYIGAPTEADEAADVAEADARAAIEAASVPAETPTSPEPAPEEK